MNRPKFRAWDKWDKIMLEVHGIDFDAKGIWTNETVDDESDGGFIHFSDIELLQSTGLKDKNGKEIYIGDILEYEMVMGFGWYENGKEVVVYDENELKIKTKYNNSLNRVVATGCEVVGNIYQHPHLLEEE